MKEYFAYLAVTFGTVFVIALILASVALPLILLGETHTVLAVVLSMLILVFDVSTVSFIADRN